MSYTNNDLIGLMGQCEMECAAARILNIAKERQCLFPDVVVKRSDMMPSDDNEQDGFVDLVGYGWLEAYGNEKEHQYRPTMGFVARIRKRIPTA